MSDTYVLVKICEQIESNLERDDLAGCRRRIKELADFLDSQSFSDPAYEEVSVELDNIISEINEWEQIRNTPTDHIERETLDIVHRVLQLYLRESKIETRDIQGSVNISDIRNSDDVESKISEMTAKYDEIESESMVWRAVAEHISEQAKLSTSALTRAHEKSEEIDMSEYSIVEDMKESGETLEKNQRQVNEHLRDMRQRLNESSEEETSESTLTADDATGVVEGIVEESYSTGGGAIKTDLADDGILYLKNIEIDASVGDDVKIYYKGENPTANDIIYVENVNEN